MEYNAIWTVKVRVSTVVPSSPPPPAPSPHQSPTPHAESVDLVAAVCTGALANDHARTGTHRSPAVRTHTSPCNARERDILCLSTTRLAIPAPTFSRRAPRPRAQSHLRAGRVGARIEHPCTGFACADVRGARPARVTPHLRDVDVEGERVGRQAPPVVLRRRH